MREGSKSKGQGKKPLIVILGPTASGKSALALRLALRWGGEIVNCDSMQMVRFLDIGTAKPTLEERSRVPHHLYDLFAPDQRYSAGEYMQAARQVCREIAERGAVPFVVGGTGLYLRALIAGIFPGLSRFSEVRSRLRRIEKKRGAGYLHRLLAFRDPVSARRLRKGDMIRLIRALEVYFVTGSPISQLHKTAVPLEGFDIVRIGLRPARCDLYDRINRRVDRMFAGGFVQEIERLLAQGYSPEAKGFEALGYRHGIALVRGEIDLMTAVAKTQRDTRRYAKRQLTWFRREPDVNWIDYAGESGQAYRSAVRLLGTVEGCKSDGI